MQTFSIAKDLLRALFCFALLAKQAFSCTFVVAKCHRQNWRVTGMKKVMTVSTPSATLRTGERTIVAKAGNSSPTARLPLTCPCFVTAHFIFCEASSLDVLLVSAAPALNARMMRQAKKRIGAMEIADTPELKSVPQWFEQKMLRNDTKFQAQTARANFCSFPIENVKDAQIETNSKFKLSKNMWLQTSDWHIPNS